ncbi:DUF2867 domain-containing protein [Allorhizobium sp. NPDC080224]|uniref:DUF2867 domain-containing protein n=1 Tax=Rhizobium rosettiformans TaxID=1368430 RepID=A0ABX7ES24_9HYPH|nr:DUF2867 domain-containing protein [Rhizobium rosettiformans]ODS58388.1 MAG: hypothetical protein ABS40_02275 [Agrobacterium sp. SCN 61-19]QRF50797.1 DUF2867 domain-containing protein [Rhizobium rosettiformans]
MGVVVEQQVALPHPDLPEADWADSYGVRLDGSDLDPMEVARDLMGRAPRWVGALLKIRNLIVGFFGLKSAELELTGQDRIGGFPVIAHDGDHVLLGFNDKHLDFRIIVAVEPEGTGHQHVSLTTLVQRHNLFGRVYILVVTPFHKLIVKTFLKRFAASRGLSRRSA